MKDQPFAIDRLKVTKAISALEAIAGQIEQVAWILEGIQETDTTTRDHDAFIYEVNDETSKIEEVKNSLDTISARLDTLIYKSGKSKTA